MHTAPLPADLTLFRLSKLALSHPAASRVFHRHRLDFCCGGAMTLAEACAKRGVDANDIAAELTSACQVPSSAIRWEEKPLPELVQHILTAFHADHRDELPRLVEMARKVERVHAERADVPHGLCEHLETMLEAMELHMQKEEQVLFPMLLSGRGRMAMMPIQVMEEEHRDHGQALERMRVLANDYKAPADGCGTWSALYMGLAAFEEALMAHIALENHVLFPRGLRG